MGEACSTILPSMTLALFASSVFKHGYRKGVRLLYTAQNRYFHSTVSGVMSLPGMWSAESPLGHLSLHAVRYGIVPVS